MKLGSRVPTLICVALSVLCFQAAAVAGQIEGRITTTLTVMENSVLVGDVTCAVENAPCIVLGAPNITLDLDGYAITGLANAETGCAGGGTATEIGIDVNGMNGAIIRGPGLVSQFRGHGIRLQNSNGGKVKGVTTSTNCFAGIFLSASSGYELEDNVAVRNGHLVSPCGGIWLTGGSRQNRLRANRVSGNGYVAPGNNFGIGFIAAAVQENIVEDNTITGNVHGIRLVAGTEKNIFRKNLVMGNPAVETSVRNAPAAGYDILNLASPDANTFEENWCLTALNGPCPALERSLAAFPNPIPVSAGSSLGMTTISWNVPGVERIEVHVGAPTGNLFAAGGSRGSEMTGLWVTDGLRFYLQDVSGGKPLTPANTLATVTLKLERNQ